MILRFIKIFYRLLMVYIFDKPIESITMPAQSGDSISSALHHSLSTSLKKCKSGEDIDSRLCDKQLILSNEIKYEKTKCFNTTILNDLKDKYIVLNTVPSFRSEEVTSTKGSVVSEVSSPKKLVPSSKEPTSLPSPKRVLYSPDSVRLGWAGSAAVGSGFVNLGNTCYLNSSLQALFHVPAFVNWLLTDTNHSSKCESLNGLTHSECLICAMCKTLQSSQKSTGSVIKPSLIYSKLKLICKHLTHGHQEDAHEFLRYLIEGMERSYLTIFNGIKLDSYSKETTPLSQIFGGYLRSEVTCLECQHVSTTFQHFQDLLLDIRTATSVDDALESFFSRERLGDGDQAYRCEQCKRRVAATKKFTIERPPKALCIALKRFGAMGGKNSKTISLKQFLDIDKFRHQRSSSESCLYKLVSMVTHLGPSSSCGHYTAVGQTPSGNYYLFDDSLVRPLPIHNVLNSNPYILIYELDTDYKKQPHSIPKKEIVTNGFSNSNGLSNSITESKQSASSSISSSNACLSTPSQSESKAGQNGFNFFTNKNRHCFKLNYLGRTDNHPAGPSFTGPRLPNEEQSSSSPQKNNEALKTISSQNLQQNNALKQLPQKELASCTEKPIVKPVSLDKAPPSKIDFPQSSSLSKAHFTSSPSKPSSSRSSSPEKGFLSKDNSVSRIPLPNNCTPEKKLEEKVLNNPEENKSSPSRSLVPYESDGASESDGEFIPPKSNLAKDFPKLGNKTLERVSPPTVHNIKGVRVEVEGSNHIQGHNRPELHSPAGSSSSGKWSVTSLDKEKSPDPPEKTPTSKIIIEQNDRISNGTSSNGVKNERWGSPKNSNSTVEHLLKKSHFGYGSPVKTWNDERSEMDRQVEGERDSRKRSHDSYNDDFDRGKVKKMKTYHSKESYRNGRNRFQHMQNQKNMWRSGGYYNQSYRPKQRYASRNYY